MTGRIRKIEFIAGRILQLLAIPAMALVIFSLYSAKDTSMKGMIEKVMVEIKPIDNNIYLVTKPVLGEMLRKKFKDKFKGQTIENLDMTLIESTIEHNDFVKDAQVYVDARNIMHIKVQQRNPILRVISQNESSFYIDEDGVKIPFQRKAVIRLPVLTGDLPVYKTRLANDPKSFYSDIFKLTKAIEADPFMSSLAEQILVDEQKDLCIMPKIGNHKIIFGNADNVEKKFKKLEIFYMKAMPKDGWKIYKEINLKFKNQVIAKKQDLELIKN